MIHVEEVSKVYRVHQKEAGLKGSIRSLFQRKWIEKSALKKVSLKVEAGEIVGLVGANGAGKTTLVKILSGIIHPSYGTVKVLGHIPFERKNELRRQIALIMGQKAQLWWDLPAADCFLLLREIYQISKKDFENRLAFLSSTLKVQDQLNVQIRRLSLGERMKMELIAALLHQPKVVYLDEPTIGLDLTAQKAIREFILDYRQEHQPAMILTSHYMEDIEKLCERIVIIRDGEIVYDGPLKRVVYEFATHKTISVKLGEINQTQLTSFHLPEELGKVIRAQLEEIKVTVQRSKVASTASYLFEKLPVIDLSIEEEDIGTVIESIMQKGLH